MDEATINKAAPPASTAKASTKGRNQPPIPGEHILNSLADPLLLVDSSDRIRFVNLSAEAFFAAGANVLRRQGLSDVVPFDSPLLSLVNQVRKRGHSIAEYGLIVATPRIGAHHVDVQITPVPEEPSYLVVTLRERGIASKID
ncbi:MAG: PAS domain-containing protein, partial [Alphaproteobacteria bacterium]|nr:PAS domain-containing protein [Alphaproteobacteria bacterium]